MLGTAGHQDYSDKSPTADGLPACQEVDDDDYCQFNSSLSVGCVDAAGFTPQRHQQLAA
jgi:hypothetical protein